MVRGIDVSNHQGIIDWPAVANAGYEFAFMKATEGTYLQDEFFPENWHGAKAAGLVRGAYHFATPFNTPNARDEADYFYDYMASLGDLENGDMLMLDAEVTKTSDFGDYGSWYLYWLEIMESYLDVKPLMYTSKHYASALNITDPKFADYGLWMAQYVLNPQAANVNNIPSAPMPWPFAAFWQYTEKGHVLGVNGPCDLNIFNGTKQQMLEYGFKQEKPIPSQIDVQAIQTELKVIENAETAIEMATINIARALNTIEQARSKIDILLRG